MKAALLALLLAGCGAQAVPYCSEVGGDEKACFASEAERSADWHRREAVARAAYDAAHPAEARARVAARAQVQADFEARQRVAADRQADESAARATSDDEHERRRAEARAALAEHDRRIELARTRTSDPAFAVPALSAIVCRYETDAVELRGLLQREARVTALAGVVDRRARLGIAGGIVDDQTKAEARRAELRSDFGASPLPCRQLERLQACHAHDDACEPGARDVVDVWRAFDHEL